MADKPRGSGKHQANKTYDRNAPLNLSDMPRSQYMPATALAAMRAADLAEPERIVPEISVRVPLVPTCVEPVPCVGTRERRHTCGPSPVTSKGSSEIPCGQPGCFNEDVCSCRCYCGLRHEMAGEAGGGNVTFRNDFFPRPISRTKVHMARIRGLEPRGVDFDWVRYSRPQVWREERRHYISRPPRYAHALLEDKKPCVCRCPWHTQCFYVPPWGVREFWHPWCY